VPKIAYGEEKNLRAGTLAIISWADGVATDYARRGLELTVRQLYYQGVSANLFPNSERSYKNLIHAVGEGRMHGLIDWNHLTDRGRNAHGTGWAGHQLPTIESLFQGRENYRTHDLWEGQEFRPEVWIEKQALEQVAERGANRWRVPYIACKGYMSASEMWSASYHRLTSYMDAGQVPVIIHLGDHDPSGIDMSRDIEERLTLFADDRHLELRRIALNMDQIDAYQPPPNPAKSTDSRFAGYIREYGSSSWELDALRPEMLIDLIGTEIQSLIDFDIWNERMQEEEEAQDEMREFTDLLDGRIDEVKTYLEENPA
jgi:hypothetical protein